MIFNSPPTALWVILDWFKPSDGITIKVSNILRLLVITRKGIQLLIFLLVFLLYYVVDNAWKGTLKNTLQALPVAAYIRKKALNARKRIECTCTQMYNLNSGSEMR